MAEKNIAMLFLTYENILHRDNQVLREYLDNTNVYIHPKDKTKITAEFEKNVIPFQVETTWATDTIVISTILLLQESYKNTHNKWFVLCSEDVFPVRTYQDFSKYLEKCKKSLFNEMPKDNRITNTNIIKTSQWWALTRNDVKLLLDSLNIRSFSKNDGNAFVEYIRNQPIFKVITSKVPKKAALDELFFLSVLKMAYKNKQEEDGKQRIQPYEYENKTICYTKWFDWVSKHPTIFNRLLSNDKEFIDTHESCFFIRKTFPTFTNEVITKKDNCIIIVIGTENKNIPDYYTFLSKYQDNSDIFLLVMIDNMSEIKSSDIKEACCQCYFVVWNMVKEASNKLTDIMKNELKYNNVVIIPEETDANQYISEKIVLEQAAKPEQIESISSLKNVDTEWVERWSDKHNRKYWYNNNTQESTWLDPKNTKTTQSEWVEKWSDKHNRKYWYNNNTQESTWVDPSLIKKGGKNLKKSIKNKINRIKSNKSKKSKKINK